MTGGRRVPTPAFPAEHNRSALKDSFPSLTDRGSVAVLISLAGTAGAWCISADHFSYATHFAHRAADCGSRALVHKLQFFTFQRIQPTQNWGKLNIWLGIRRNRQARSLISR